jgi:hypothetical protein
VQETVLLQELKETQEIKSTRKGGPSAGATTVVRLGILLVTVPSLPIRRFATTVAKMVILPRNALIRRIKAI